MMPCVKISDAKTHQEVGGKLLWSLRREDTGPHTAICQTSRMHTAAMSGECVRTVMAALYLHTQKKYVIGRNQVRKENRMHYRNPVADGQ